MIDYYDETDTIFEDAYTHASEYRILDLKYMVKTNADKRLCVFGTGKVFIDCFHDLERDLNHKIDYISDNNSDKWGKSFFGVKCISVDELRSVREDVFIALTAIDQWMPIARQLKQEGFTNVFPRLRWVYGNSGKFDSPEWLRQSKDKFKKMLDILHDDYSRHVAITNLRNKLARDILKIDYDSILSSGREYFPEDIIRLGNDECFVDAGAYDGRSLLSFLEQTSNCFETSYHLELDDRNYQLLQKTVALLPNELRKRIVTYPFGLWDKNQTVSFSGEGMGSTITDDPEAPCVGRVKRLDDVLEGKKVTMIKMDIEAAETKALRGAETIIRTQHPKLAICVYHRLEDLWEVPLIINDMNPDYQISLRHYTKIDVDNVCYAVAPN